MIRPASPVYTNQTAERCVLGACMVDHSVIPQVSEIVTASDFHFIPHSDIFKAILKVNGIGQAPDRVAVFTELQRMKVNIEPEVLGVIMDELLDTSGDLASTLYYAQLVLEASQRRSLYNAGSRAKVIAGNAQTPMEAVAEIEKMLEDVKARTVGSPAVDIRKAEELWRNSLADRDPLAGIEFGIVPLDEFIGKMRPGQINFVAARPGVGKCFKPGTLVLMFDGTTRAVESIRPGEKVMGPDSKPRTVLELSEGVAEMYEIRPIKGEPFTVNEEHILSLRMNRARGAYAKGQVIALPLRRWFEAPYGVKHNAKLWRTGVKWPRRRVPIDPYVLGLWLGDGSSNKTEITTMDPEAQRAVDEYAASIGCTTRIYRKPGNRAVVACVTRGRGAKRNPMRQKLRKLGIFGDKRIPRAYLINARPVRLALLAGLADSDGYAEHNGLGFTLKSKGLMDDLVFLARSLGYAAYPSTCRKTIKSRKFSGQYYRVHLSGALDEVPVRLARRRTSERRINKNQCNVGFSVEPTGPGRFAGFSVDGDHQFLLADFTVVHNSAFCEQVACAAARTHRVLLLPLEMGRDTTFDRILNRRNTVTDLTGLMIGDSDRPMNIDAIWAEAVRTRAELVVIDHARHIDGWFHSRRGEGRDQAPTRVLFRMHRMAAKLRIPVLLAHQLNRDTEHQGIPTLGNLRDAGSIEELAWRVIFLHRPGMADYDSTDSIIDIIVAKNRSGQLGRVQANWDGTTARIWWARLPGEAHEVARQVAGPDPSMLEDPPY